MLVLYYDNDNSTDRIQKFWNTATKATETVTLATTGGTAYNYLAGFVDAYQVGTTVIIKYGSPSGADNLAELTYPNFSLLEAQTKTTTLSTYKAIYIYSIAGKNIVNPITLNLPAGHDPAYSSNLPNNNTYLKSSSEIVEYYCMGTTKREVYYAGDQVLNYVNIENSELCGYAPPAATPGLQVFEAKVIKIDHECHSNPVMLKWANSLGGWDQYMFDYDQQEDITTETSAEIKNYLAFINTSKSNAFQLGKPVKKTMILGAENLDENDFNGIVPDLLISAYVCIVYPLGSGISDLRVMVSPGTFSKTSRNQRHAIEFEIKLPDLFIVRN